MACTVLYCMASGGLTDHDRPRWRALRALKLDLNVSDFAQPKKKQASQVRHSRHRVTQASLRDSRFWSSLTRSPSTTGPKESPAPDGPRWLWRTRHRLPAAAFSPAGAP